jgi:hypothetical protein
MQTAIDRLTQEGTRWLTIDALKDGAAEIERLRIERDDLQVLLKGRTAEFQAEIERLRAEVERLTAEAEEWDADTERHVARMAGLLHDTANAVHGGPLAGGMWSWHDLPDLASAERALADQLVRLLPHFHLSQRCRPPQGIALQDWCSECAAIAAYEEARRG